MNALVPVLVGLGVTGLAAALLVGRLLVRHGQHWTDAVAIEGIAAIGAIGWMQSYVSLRSLALLGREPEWEADSWPAVLDVFALIMGLAAVRARREGDPDRYAEILAIFYSAAAIAGNVWTSLPDPVTVVVHGLPPLTMVVGWHWLLRRSAAPAEPSRGATPVTDSLASLDVEAGLTADICKDPIRDNNHGESADANRDVVRDVTGIIALDKKHDAVGDRSPDHAEDIEPDIPTTSGISSSAAPRDGEPSPAYAELEDKTTEEPARTGDMAARAKPGARRPTPTSPAGGRNRRPRDVVRRMLRLRGPAVTTAEVVTRTGVSSRHAARLLRQERDREV